MCKAESKCDSRSSRSCPKSVVLSSCIGACSYRWHRQAREREQKLSFFGECKKAPKLAVSEKAPKLSFASKIPRLVAATGVVNDAPDLCLSRGKMPEADSPANVPLEKSLGSPAFPCCAKTRAQKDLLEQLAPVYSRPLQLSQFEGFILSFGMQSQESSTSNATATNTLQGFKAMLQRRQERLWTQSPNPGQRCIWTVATRRMRPNSVSLPMLGRQRLLRKLSQKAPAAESVCTPDAANVRCSDSCQRDRY